MGIPGEFDSPRLADAYHRVVAACRRVSVNGRRVSCGLGGLKYVTTSHKQVQADRYSGRLDLIQHFGSLYPEARFVMAGANNGTLLAAMRKGSASFKSLNMT